MSNDHVNIFFSDKGGQKRQKAAWRVSHLGRASSSLVGEGRKAMKRVSLFKGKRSSGVSIRFWAERAIPALFLALACMFAGCDSDDDADADNSGAGGEGDSYEAGAAGTGGKDASAGAEGGTDAGSEPGDDGITLSWRVLPVGENFFYWLFEPGLEGVEVCLIENVDIPCVSTNEDGVFVLPGVPKNSELLLTFTRQGYVPYLVSVRTGTANIEAPEATQPFMMQKNRFDEEHDALGMVVDEDKGGINLVALDTSLRRSPGRLSVSIHPQEGDGPLFWDTNLHIVPNATGLSEETPIATFLNLDKGEYVISWELEEPEYLTCGILGHISLAGVSWNPLIYGLPAEQPNAMRVKVRPGFASGVSVIVCGVDTADICQEPADGTGSWSDISDNFDSYAVGANLAQEAGEPWVVWDYNSGGPLDAVISDAQAFSGANSLLVETDDDLVLELGTLAEGAYQIDFQIYVPSGNVGYFNIMQRFWSEEESSSGAEGYNFWGVNVWFDDGGTGVVVAGGQDPRFNYTQDVWVAVSALIDLDANEATMSIGGEEVHSWAWDLDILGIGGVLNCPRLGGVDFHGISTDSNDDEASARYYIDEVSVVRL